MRTGLTSFETRDNRQWRVSKLSLQLQIEPMLRGLGITEWELKGDEYIHSCSLPFGLHKNQDQSRSASFNAKNLLFNCFVCGGGDILWWIGEVLDEESKGVQKFLSDYHDKDQKGDLPFKIILELLRQDNEIEGTRAILPNYSEKIIDSWVGVNSYFTDRGINEEVQIKMKTGSHEGRAIIPVFFNHTLVGWSGRRMTEDTHDQFMNPIPKYKHSHGFPKASTIYNYDNINKEEETIVVESPMTTLYLMSHNIQSVATFGAKVTQGQLELLKRLSHIVIAGDGDEAGKEFENELLESLSKYSQVSVIHVPLGKDLGDIEDPHALLEEKIPSILCRMTS